MPPPPLGLWSRPAREASGVMTISVPGPGRTAQQTPKKPKDFQEHLAALERRGLVVKVDRPINKDTELHPLARWQFQGALAEDKRRAFLFTNVIGSDGRFNWNGCQCWPLSSDRYIPNSVPA